MLTTELLPCPLQDYSSYAAESCTLQSLHIPTASPVLLDADLKGSVRSFASQAAAKPISGTGALRSEGFAWETPPAPPLPSLAVGSGTPKRLSGGAPPLGRPGRIHGPEPGTAAPFPATGLGAVPRPTCHRMGVFEEAPTGTCLEMCPAGELARRRRQGRLHVLERGPPEQAVKEYSRPAAGKERPRPEELRPPPVLLATVRHLLGEAARGRPDVSAAEQCAFVSDRLRAVRLDLTVQRVSGRPCAAVLERSLVYLLRAGHQLCAEPPARFDAHLHRAQVQECFAALRRAYRGQEEEEDRGSDAEPLFQALFLLYNLGSPDALWQILQLPHNIRTTPELSIARAINLAYLERNFARFFCLARELPYLQSCALHPHVARARYLALLTFSHGFSSKNCRYPLERLARLLAMDSLKEAEALCQAQGLTMLEGSITFQKGSFKDSGPLNHRPSCLLVDGKWGETTLQEFTEGICS
ncbi:SAC3 domain-containing protein 1 [Paroedura picta]|uniref:SAC3 domain-containing protein 1 n=1 Tax=Paroedura picta TaxID=143630 RepID=UPI0040575397